MFSSLLAFIFLIPASLATNDWDTPCLQGSCSYEPPVSASGSLALHLSGSSTAISDLTSAAGWQILGCDKNTLAQDIRAVCVGQNSTCNHLYNNGAKDTLVRLPEDCGQMPFARIADEWEHSNQTIPTDVAETLSRRDDQPQSTVRGFTLDTEFHLVDVKQHGEVSMVIRGSSHSRDAVDALAARELPGPKSETGAGSGAFFYKGVDQTILQHANTNCYLNGYLASSGVHVNLTSEVVGSTLYEVDVKGTVAPPKITAFTLNSNLSASINGSLSVLSTAVVGATKSIQLLRKQLNVTFHVPGFLTITPMIDLNATAAVNLDAHIDTVLGFAYEIQNGAFSFPPTTAQSTGFHPQNHSVTLMVDEGIQNLGQVRVDMTPEISFDIVAFSGPASVATTIANSIDIYNNMFMHLDTNVTDGCLGITTGLTGHATSTNSFFDLFRAGVNQTYTKGDWQVFVSHMGNPIGETCNPSNYRRAHSRGIKQMKRDDMFGCLPYMPNRNVLVMGARQFDQREIEARPLVL